MSTTEPDQSRLARPGLARWGRTALAGLTPGAWVLGAPIDIRAVARRPAPLGSDGEADGARAGSQGWSPRER